MRLKLYLWILGVSIAITWGVNFFFNAEASMLMLNLWAWINPITIFGLDALIATILHHSFIPASYFSVTKKRFQVSQKELHIYRCLKINKWKDYIPDTGKQTTGLSKSKIESTNADYLSLFLTETCYAEVIHIWMALMGIIPCFLAPQGILWQIAVPHAVINFVLNIPPIMIQRNNRPKLLHMYERQQKKQQQN